MRSVILFSRKISLWLLPIVGVAYILLATKPFGMGVAHDSVFYISMAKHMAVGKGAYVFMSDIDTKSGPMAHYCPGLSAALAVLFMLKLSIRDSIWMLNSLLFGLNIFIATRLIQKSTGSLTAGLFTGWVFLVSSMWQSAHCWILTEPLYLALTNSAIFFLWKYFDKENDALLLLSGLLTGMGCLTRYTGISYAAAGALCLILFLKTSPGRRLKKAMLYSVIASAPFFLWLLRNILRNYKPGSAWAEMAFGDVGVPKSGIGFSFFDYVTQSINAFFEWLPKFVYIPFAPHFLFKLAFAVLAISGVCFLFYKKNSVIKNNHGVQLPFILFVYGLVYILFLILYLRLSHQKIPMDQRYMMIFYSYIIFIMIYALHWLWRNLLAGSAPKTIRSLGLSLGLVIFLAWSWVSIQNSWQSLDKMRRLGPDETRGFSWFYLSTRQWLPKQ